MRVLIGCEESQAVCKAFRAKGHEAYSCDLQPCSGGHPEWHLQMDVFKAIRLLKPEMGIMHPPCDFLSNAGNAYLSIDKYGKKAINRRIKQLQAAQFFMRIYNCKIKKICIENPVGFINSFMPPTQTIHPYFFGDHDNKRTCLWLRNLPPLQHTKTVDLFSEATHVTVQPTYIDTSGKPRYFSDSISGHRSDANLLRSKTFPGIAAAMAEQWG